MKKSFLAAFLSASIALLCACGEGKESIILDNGSSSAPESSSFVSGGITSDPTNQNESTSTAESNNSSSSALESEPAGSTSDFESFYSEPDASSSSSITSQSSTSSSSTPQSSSSSSSKPQSSSSSTSKPQSSSGSSSTPETVTSESDFIVEPTEGGVCIMDYTGKDKVVVIPDTIGGQKVVGIGIGAFGYNKDITSVTIPASVKWFDIDESKMGKHSDTISYVGGITTSADGAFAGCDNLKEVIFLGDDLPEFFEYDFYETPWLEAKKAENPDYLVIKNTLVSWRKREETVEIPDGIKAIGSYAFYFTGEIKNIKIPNSVTKIGKGAFYYCYDLENIIIPDSVTELGAGAFLYCPELKKVTLSQNITCIKYSTFDFCLSIEEIVLPDNLTKVEAGGYIMDSPDYALYLSDCAFIYKEKKFENLESIQEATKGTVIWE